MKLTRDQRMDILMLAVYLFVSIVCMVVAYKTGVNVGLTNAAKNCLMNITGVGLP